MGQEGSDELQQASGRSVGRIGGLSKTDLFFAMMEASELEELRLEIGELREIIEGLRAIIMRIMAHPQGKHVLWSVFKDLKIDRRTARRLLEDRLIRSEALSSEAMGSEAPSKDDR